MTDPKTVANPTPLTGSQRVALSRKRKRKDIVFVGIEVLPTERDALIRIGLLNKVARNDKAAVRDALYAYFEKYLDLEPPSPTSPLWSTGTAAEVIFAGLRGTPSA